MNITIFIYSSKYFFTHCNSEEREREREKVFMIKIFIKLLYLINNLWPLGLEGNTSVSFGFTYL